MKKGSVCREIGHNLLHRFSFLSSSFSLSYSLSPSFHLSSSFFIFLHFLSLNFPLIFIFFIFLLFIFLSFISFFFLLFSYSFPCVLWSEQHDVELLLLSEVVVETTQQSVRHLIGKNKIKNRKNDQVILGERNSKRQFQEK